LTVLVQATSNAIKHAPHPSSLTRAGLVRVGLLAGAGIWCLAAVELTASAADGLAALRSGRPTVDEALGGLAAAFGLAVLAWTALVTGCAALAALLPRGSSLARTAGRVGARITPAAGRRLLAVLLGAALVSGAAPAQAAAGTCLPRAVALLDPGGPPLTTHLATGSPSGSTADLDPGWVPPPKADLDPRWGAPVARTPATSAPVGSAPVGSAPVGSAPDSAAPARAASGLDPSWAPPGRLRPGVIPDATLVVRRGDTLWSLAARHLGPGATDAEIAQAWPYWFTANRAVIGPDPDELLPGQRLHPPESSPGGVA
jgi:resuscitation-promoting factor RpfA